MKIYTFFKNRGEKDPAGFGWDYVLVDNDKVVNAWAWWKIAVYTGLYNRKYPALSIVIGHEIAHAVADTLWKEPS